MEELKPQSYLKQSQLAIERDSDIENVVEY